jgi:hypothetical protein
MVERGGPHTYSHLRAIIELGDALAECRTIAQARFHRLALIMRSP